MSETSTLVDRLRFYRTVWGKEPCIAPHSMTAPGYTTGLVIREANEAADEIERLRLALTNPNLIAFAKEVLRAGFAGQNLDGGDLQEMGVKHGLLAETTYDPSIHGPNQVDAEPGDPWFVFAGPLAKT